MKDERRGMTSVVVDGGRRRRRRFEHGKVAELVVLVDDDLVDGLIDGLINGLVARVGRCEQRRRRNNLGVRLRAPRTDQN